MVPCIIKAYCDHEREYKDMGGSIHTFTLFFKIKNININILLQYNCLSF